MLNQYQYSGKMKIKSNHIQEGETIDFCKNIRVRFSLQPI